MRSSFSQMGHFVDGKIWPNLHLRVTDTPEYHPWATSWTHFVGTHLLLSQFTCLYVQVSPHLSVE